MSHLIKIYACLQIQLFSSLVLKELMNLISVFIVANGAMESKLKQSEDHYTYVNMDQMAWDLELGFWKPKGSIGDRYVTN